MTDPPYGSGVHSWDTHVPGPTVWREALRVTRPGGHIAAFGSVRRWHQLATNIERGGWKIVDTLLWIRAACPHARDMGQTLLRAGVEAWDDWTPWKTELRTVCEPIVLAVKPSPLGPVETAERYGTGGLHIGRRDGSTHPYPADVLVDADVELPPAARRFVVTIGRTRKDRLNEHPTVKPIEVMRWLVNLTRSHGGHAVLDPFAGSGTTGVACALEGLPFVGVERDAHYVEVARQRIAEGA